jgi:hypothetical protein
MYHLEQSEIFKDQEELFQNGKPKLCPYRVPMMVQKSALGGSPVPLFPGCGTHCPLFHISKEREIQNVDQSIIRTYAEIRCTGSTFKYEIESALKSNEQDLLIKALK